MKDRLSAIIASFLGITSNDLSLEIPDNQDFGDYTTSVAMRAFADKTFLEKLPESLKIAKNPYELAANIVNAIEEKGELSDYIEKILAIKPGFINIWLKDEVLIDNLIQISKSNYYYGSSDIGKNKRVVIDYSSPNIAKRFSIGHLRSTIIGQSLYNIYEFLGYKVIGDNHLGDWGTQFGKLIYMLKRHPLESGSGEGLEKLYVKYHQLAKGEEKEKMDFEARAWFAKLEKGVPMAREIWRKCVSISMREFNRIYDLLGVSFDMMMGESRYSGVLKRLLKNKHFLSHLSEGESGAKIIDLSEYGIKTPLMFLKSDGATTYAARDLACLYYRMRRFEPHIVIYEVGKEQTLHFKQVFAAARKLGWVDDSVILYHTAHGLYLSPSGKKFSTREGGVVNLEDVLLEAIKKAGEIVSSSKTARNIPPKDLERITNDIGIGAIKYFDLKHSVGSDIVFDWSKILDLKGNSGPYIQYTFARTNSVLEKAKERGIDVKNLEYSDIEVLRLDLTDSERDIARLLFHFGEFVKKAAVEFSPKVICDYLFALCQRYNSFYDKYPILKEKNAKKKMFRLKLTEDVGWVIRNGLRLLGIEVVEKM